MHPALQLYLLLWFLGLWSKEQNKKHCAALYFMKSLHCFMWIRPGVEILQRLKEM